MQYTYAQVSGWSLDQKGISMANALIKKTPSVRRSEQAAVKQAIMDALIILGVTKGAKK